MMAATRPCYTRHEAHKFALEDELMYEEFQCQQDRTRSRKRLLEIRRELDEIRRFEEAFYDDPMTAYYGAGL